MKVNHNISAMITNKQLLRTESNLTDAMERLSSGLKLNHAKDNPAGMAISNKMQLQIDGLTQASRNASDGTSVLQTTDGALNEVTELIQRMRELAVQTASDVNTPDDKAAAQKEIESLKQEINRVSRDTEFNTKTLLNGSIQRRVYMTNASRVNVSDAVVAGDYSVTINQAAQQAQMSADNAAFTNMAAPIGAGGTMKINGSLISIEATDTYEEVYEKIREGGELGETVVDIQAGALEFTSVTYGEQGEVKVSVDNPLLAEKLGFDPAGPVAAGGTMMAFGTNAEVDIHTADSGFEATATAELRGNRVTVTDRDGFSISFLTDSNLAAGSTVDIEVTNMGTMELQIGANENQSMNIAIPEVSTEMLYLDDLDVTTVTGASRAIDALDEALTQVTAIRSSIGAYENRLDYAVGSLDQTTENMTSALSRIQDVNMAMEMSNYTQQNVLEQAAISVLTQANDLPQQTLQLLQ